jgi:HD superfamily phosphodiesterase
LAKDFRRIFGSTHDETAERLGSLARRALYHNMEHTLLVMLAGRDILQGRSLSHRIEPSDYTHLICACLLHDIGYVRGVLSGDTETEFVVDRENRKVKIPRGASDAALTASRSRAATFHSESNRVSGTYLRAFALDMNRPGHRCGGAWLE